jgi:hypothetical protein
MGRFRGGPAVEHLALIHYTILIKNLYCHNMLQSASFAGTRFPQRPAGAGKIV